MYSSKTMYTSPAHSKIYQVQDENIDLLPNSEILEIVNNKSKPLVRQETRWLTSLWQGQALTQGNTKSLQWGGKRNRNWALLFFSAILRCPNPQPHFQRKCLPLPRPGNEHYLEGCRKSVTTRSVLLWAIDQGIPGSPDKLRETSIPIPFSSFHSTFYGMKGWFCPRRGPLYFICYLLQMTVTTNSICEAVQIVK